MKIFTQGTKVSRFAVSFLLLSVSPLALGQDDDGYFMDDGSDVYNSEQINIDANYTRRESAADRIAKMRKKLERDNEQMVQKKIEDIRIEQEQELAGRLKNALSGEGSLANNDGYGQQDRYDDVSVVSAAPQRVEAVLDDEDDKTSLRNKIIPTIGASQYDGDRIDAFETKTSVGVNFENMLTNYFSMGLGINYTAMDITYVENIGFFGYYNNFGYLTTTSDEITYKNLNLNVSAKLFMAAETTVKPFVGAMLGYNRGELSFEQRSSGNFGAFPGYTFEESSVTGSHVSATGMIGAEIDFAENIGMVIDFRYTRNLTNGFDALNRGFSNNFNVDNDRRILNDIGSRLENSDVAALNLGFLVRF